MTWVNTTGYEDTLFRVRKKKGEAKVVDAPSPAIEAPIADAHTHLGPGDAPLVLARAAAHGVDFICTIATATDDLDVVYAQLDTWREDAREVLARIAPAVPAVPRVRIAAGCHPHDASKFTPEVRARLIEVLHDPRTCAVGEIGLDYYYNNSEPEAQRRVFREQLRIAHEAGLPVQLHVRDAHAEAFEILQEEGFPAAGVMLHCCSLPPDELRPWIDAGCYISYGGAITFGRSDDARAAAALVPAGRVLTETDAPYMTPVPLRGSKCESAHTVFTCAKLAEVFGCAPGDARRALLQRFHDNALELLDKEPTAWQTA
ncbi:MAG: TatD family hydrolase [Coriobacteriaceae bacterium]|nr:TatD family hydrolase [Coriobacteriaceae bacterium]